MQKPTFEEQYDELYPPAKPAPKVPVQADLFDDPVPIPVPPAPKAKKPKPTK